MDLYLEISGDQIDGARDYQEDAFMVTYLDEEGGDARGSALVIMADGMGGHAAGNIASNLVVTTFNRTFTGKFGDDDASNVLREALAKGNDALSASIKETPALDGMGCTMVTASFSKGKVNWVSVGDSHLYLIRDRALVKKNEDHSYGGYLDRMKAQGIDVEPEPGLSRNMLMSAMTGDEIAEIDCPNNGFQLLPGDRLIVASDGLDTLNEATIIQTSAWSQTAKECVGALLKAVEEAKKPRQDNTTVIVVDVQEREAPAAPAPAPAAAQAPSPSDTQPLDVALAADEADEYEYEYVEEEEGGGKKGLLIAIAAVVLIAIGAGAYFVLGGSGEPPQDTTEIAAAPEPGTESVAASEPAAGTESTSPATGTEQPETTTSTTEPAAVPAPVEPPKPAAEPVAKEFRDPLSSGGEAPLMLGIPGGNFKMGSGGLSVAKDERPQHAVTVSAFAISKYEVTFEEYEKFALATGRAAPDNLYLDKDVHPVIFVSWDDAYAYTQWLSEQTGKAYRLPSEAEWEYAARAGADTPYAWGYDLGQNNAHCFDCKTGLNPRQPTRVGRFEPNAFGVHDMAGNVQEWVHDCYHKNYQGAPTDGSVWEGGECQYRIARGGSYSNPGKSIRPSKRHRWTSTKGNDSVGIRLARDID